MAEIRDKVKAEIENIMSRGGKASFYTWGSIAEAILAIPELAIVEPKKICPKCSSNKTRKYGLRNFKTGIKQRHLCRNCASVFYEPLK